MQIILGLQEGRLRGLGEKWGIKLHSSSSLQQLMQEYAGGSFGFRRREMAVFVLSEGTVVLARLSDWLQLAQGMMDRGELVMVMSFLVNLKRGEYGGNKNDRLPFLLRQADPDQRLRDRFPAVLLREGVRHLEPFPADNPDKRRPATAETRS
jgi:hypothetical protein